jgi:hypothetical protein
METPDQVVRSLSSQVVAGVQPASSREDYACTWHWHDSTAYRSALASEGKRQHSLLVPVVLL